MDNIKIFGVNYQIVVKDDMDMPNVIGLCHSDKQQIWLRESNTEETNTNVLLHECLHAISDALDLELSERQVNVLATALIAFARDNPAHAKTFFDTVNVEKNAELFVQINEPPTY